MTRSEPMRSYPCPKCKAKPGDCRRLIGQFRASQHEARWNTAGLTLADLRDHHFQRQAR